jgi:hypothetical protein
MEFDLNDAAHVLARTPATVDALLRDMPDTWTRHDEGPGTWSPYAIVGHFIHGEKAEWIPRAQLILTQGPDRVFTPFDRLAQERDSESRSLNALLDEFAHLRLQNLDILQGLQITPAKLQSTGGHPEFGEVTLAQLLATWVVHDLGHLAQISRVMARAYTGAVGPWRAYLPVLHRRAE